MSNKDLVGRCGVYCGSCSIYRAYKDSAYLRESIAEKHGCKPEQVRCGGCQKLSHEGYGAKEDWGKGCKIVICLDEKGHSFCYECGDYPGCEKFQKVNKSYSICGRDLIANLRKIKEGKVEEWLKEQEAKYRCPECDQPASIHFNKCHICGASLNWRERAIDSEKNVA